MKPRSWPLVSKLRKKEHALLVALRDMAKVAATQRGLKALAKIERLEELTVEVLNAYDRGDDDGIRQIMQEVERIVNMTEGISATERKLVEVFDGDEFDDEDSPFPPDDKLPFKRGRK